MSKIGTLVFLAAFLVAVPSVLANPLPPPPTGGSSSPRSTAPQPPLGGTSGSGGVTITVSSSGGGSTATGASGGASASSTQDDSSGDSGCSLVGSRLVRRLAPWSIAGAFFVAYFFVRRRPRS